MNYRLIFVPRCFLSQFRRPYCLRGHFYSLIYTTEHLVGSWSSTIISEDCYHALVNGCHNNVFFVCVLLFAIPCEISRASTGKDCNGLYGEVEREEKQAWTRSKKKFCGTKVNHVY